MNVISDVIFPDYTIEKILKSGKRGNVSVVRHKDTKIRFVYRDFEGNGEVYRKLQEVNSLHLPKIYEVRERDNHVYVLEEYISGDTLAFLLEQNPLTLNHTKEIAVQICDALRILHELNVVHRDVKPDNIIVRGNNAVLIDFDASRVVKPERFSDTQIMGTTGYAAPEQYGFSQTDARADIYAMGILMNEMLTNQHPSKLLAEGPLRPIIERCIEVNVDKRYFTAMELQAAIRTCGQTRKCRRLSAGIVAAVLTLCIAAAVFAGGETQKEEWPSMKISEEIWQGESETIMPFFRYDLDGDGEMEEYRFGIFHADIPREFAWTPEDEFWLSDGEVSQRTVFPAVWKNHSDDTWELMEEFAPLLQDAGVQVWRGSEMNGAAPEVLESEGNWGGAVCVVFQSDCDGVWYYELRATLGDQELTAVCRSTQHDYG